MKATRRLRGPTALLTCLTFLHGTAWPFYAWADAEKRESELPASPIVDNVSVTAPSAAPGTDKTVVEPSTGRAEAPAPLRVDPSSAATHIVETPPRDGANPAATHTEWAPVASPSTASPATVQSLTIGGDKTGVSSQAISLPQGTAKLQGMGESFSTDLSTGVANFTVPFSLVPARGGAQPSLALHYSSGAGHGVAGVGWDVGVPYIARQTDRGLPQYQDPSNGGGWSATQDRFVFNGGQELVPICLVTGGSCKGELANEAMPSWAEGSQYFRPRVEGSYLRFFWMPDHRTWRVQSKSGETMELGVPLDGSGDTSGLETDPETSTHIFRWNLVRQYDAYGGANPSDAKTLPTPFNTVVYRYTTDGAMAYVSDIYDTSPKANASSAALSAYAHHTHLTYGTRPDATFSYRRGWKVTQGLRLTGVDVTSATFGAPANGSREQVRRYHLAYDSAYHVSLLASVQMEGKCGSSPPQAGDGANPVETGTGLLPSSTGCPTLPAMTFGYQHVAPFNVDGSPGTADLTGYEGFDERVTNMAQSPPNSIDEQMTDLFDINSDALPDVVVTMPGTDSKFPMYLNGVSGPNSFGASHLGVVGVLGATASGINLGNDNVAALDIDGDGTIDWVHQPQVQQYAIYTPQLLSSGWYMAGRTVPTSSLQSPQLDLGEDTPDIDVLDANGDGLVDVVRATGTEMQTFFSLDRYPGGDGNFGSAQWTGAASAALSLKFVPSCVPLVASGVPVRFSDSTIHLADMNGDGLQDIVYVQQGDVRYWPGRGDGSWGTGTLGSCDSGFAANTYIAMNDGPEYSDPNGSGLRLDDVNGDGLDDLVQVRFDAVDVWLNVDGVGFTPKRHVISNVTPASGPQWQGKVRLVDINGSGTRDILWGEGSNYRYMDLSGGQRPWVLTHVANGLGKTTDLTYESSTQLMLADAAAGKAWSSVAPMPIHVVTQSTEKDNLGVVGMPSGTYVTQYAYRDAVYDGRQREFRGFRTATSRKLGDANSPSSTTSSTFLLGECKNDESLAVDPCTPQGRWEDNPREALKGLPLTSETYDDSNSYLSSAHHTYRLRKLYSGLDGREVRVAFQSSSDTYQYDDGPFVGASSTATLTDVELEVTPGTVTSEAELTPGTQSPGSMPLHSTGYAHLTSSSQVDLFGNATDTTDSGAAGDEAITKHTTPGRPTNPSDGTSIDPSGWMWRTVESYVQGSTCTSKRNDTLIQYDSAGNPLQTTAKLTGTLPLNRFHQTNATVAPTPQQASTDNTILVSALQYDAFGVMVFASSQNGRCRGVTLDASFDELPIQETVYVGAPQGTTTPNGTTVSCGKNGLSTVAQYDRGLGVVAQVLDLHGELTTAAYDNFGRVSSLSKPDPATPTKAVSPASILFTYTLPTDASVTPYSSVLTQLNVGTTATPNLYRSLYMVADGMGRTVFTAEQADRSNGDAGDWILEKLTTYDTKGAVERVYQPEFVSGAAPQTLPVTPSTTFSHQRYDAFGRALETYGLDGTLTLRNVYHALSSDHWDAADLEVGGEHQGTFATEVHDGHGRTTAVIERIHVGNSIEQRETQTTYLPTGEPIQIKRVRDGTTSSVARWIQYDSLGRMVLNVEPDTSTGFVAFPGETTLCGSYTPPSTLKTWRYAYDDNGDLVGTTDARGCGTNYAYDAGGRITSEDYSPCLSAHATYSSPSANGDNTEVFYQYDSLPTSGLPTFPSTFAPDASLLNGRLVVVSDRGARTFTSYDGRGRVNAVARQIASPAGPSNTLSSRYAAHVYVQGSTYDLADRPTNTTTGADTSLLLASNGKSSVSTTYTMRGTVGTVSSDYGSMVGTIGRDADGLVNQIVYGDVAKTTSVFSYDQRRRLSSVQTYRGPPAIWSQTLPTYFPAPNPTATPPTSFQLLLEDTDYQYDVVDNPTAVTDWRNPVEWPAGAKPVSRKVQYDDLYRATSVGYSYTGGTDPWTSPFDAENRAVGLDPRLATPSPHVSFTNRVEAQTFQYDWLGNTSTTDDDQHGFYDRSLGKITNGTATAGPYQLTAANGGTGTRGGSLTTVYDAAGNLTSMAVDRSGTCLPTLASCHQRFAYDWDEVGRIVQARRWDLLLSAGTASGTLPTGTANARLQYTYDASDARVLKTAFDLLNIKSYTAYIFGSLELRRAPANVANSDYVLASATAPNEVAYLSSHGVRLGRVHFAEEIIPQPIGQNLHVLLEMPDHLGSTSIVVDAASSEVVERGTYMAYGQAESDYRPQRWGSFREDYRFTGKEEDVEVGLQYFGKRFYAPGLSRWINSDPKAVHLPGQADPNVYAYAKGAVLAVTDPLGLDGTGQGVDWWRALRDATRSVLDIGGGPSAAYEGSARLAAGDIGGGLAKEGEALVRGAFLPLAMSADAAEGLGYTAAAGYDAVTGAVNRSYAKQVLATAAVTVVMGTVLAKGAARVLGGGSAPAVEPSLEPVRAMADPVSAPGAVPAPAAQASLDVPKVGGGSVEVLHGTTAQRAIAIVKNGPDADFAEPGGTSPAGGFSTAPATGPYSVGSPQQYSAGKAALFPDEGGPAVIRLQVPQSIVQKAIRTPGEIRFEPGYGLEELQKAWPDLEKKVE